MSTARNRRVWADWIRLYGATLGAQGVSAVRSFVVAAQLGPAPFGLWKSLQLMLSYSNWCDLGGLRGMGREVPLLRGQGQAAEAQRIQAASWLLTLVPALLVTGAIVVAGCLVADRALGRGLIAFAPVLFTTRVMFYFFELANARKEFALKARAVLALAITDGVLAPLAAWWGGVLLFMWSITVTNILAASYLAGHLSFQWRIAWRNPAMRRVIRVGFPLALSGLAFDVLKTVDRFVIVTFLGTEAVGYYGLAMIVFELTVTVPLLFGQVLLPHLVERYGQDRNANVLFGEAAAVVRTVAGALPLLLVPCWLVLPAVAARVLPAYQPGIPAARILLWAPVFLTVHSIMSVVLVALARTGVLILVHVGAIGLAGALCWAAVAAGGGIEGVALAMVTAYGLTAAAEFVAAGFLCEQPVRRLIPAFMTTMAPLVVVISLALIVQQVAAQYPFEAAVASVAIAGLALAAFTAWQGRRVRRVAGTSKHPHPPVPCTGGPPLVTVVLPVWNGAAFIESAIHSIFAQNYSALELLVVDDHSTDATPEILARIDDPRLHVARLDRRVGGGAARNVGMRAAHGVLLAAMDADDVSHPERIRKQVDFLLTHPSHAMVTCAFDCVDARGRLLDRVYPPADDAGIRRLLIRANPFAHSAMLVRRDAIESVGGYDERSGAQDYDLYLRLARDWQLACLPEVLQRVLAHTASETVSRENWVCFSDVVARASAILRGQYPLRATRYLLRTALSVLVPLALKRRRRRRSPVPYRYYRRRPQRTTWERATCADLRAEVVLGPQADVEDADWQFLLPCAPRSRVLWLSTADPTSLTLTTAPQLVVARPTLAGDDCAGGLRVVCDAEHLPFRAGVFDLTTIDAPELPTEPTAWPPLVCELRRVLAPVGALHVGLPAWTPATLGRGSPSHLLGVLLAQQRRWRSLRAALVASGFQGIATYARLPSFAQPRYLIRGDDVGGLQFLLQRLPTHTRLRAALWRPLLAALRTWRITFAPLAPGLSVVARLEEA